MIVDTHTHWGIAWEDRYGTDPSAFLKFLDRHRVDMAALMGHRGLRRNADLKACNDTIKETCNNSGGRLIPLALVHPDYGDESIRELNRCIRDLDMRGLKLHPWRQGCSASGPVMDELCKLCGEFDVPVIFHDGTPCYSMPSQIGGLALRFPRTRFVLGHAGLLALWRSAVSCGTRCPNLYLTLCGPYQAGLRAIVNTIDENRILWGTDFGAGRSDPIGYRKGLVENLDMPESKRVKVMGSNALHLFRIEA